MKQRKLSLEKARDRKRSDARNNWPLVDRRPSVAAISSGNNRYNRLEQRAREKEREREREREWPRRHRFDERSTELFITALSEKQTDGNKRIRRGNFALASRAVSIIRLPEKRLAFATDERRRTVNFTSWFEANRRGARASPQHEAARRRASATGISKYNIAATLAAIRRRGIRLVYVSPLSLSLSRLLSFSALVVLLQIGSFVNLPLSFE